MSSMVAFDLSQASQIEIAGREMPAKGYEPLVSVIIPCYNGEKFLKETIESALGQTYPAVEVIVIDDGSTDSSGEIAQSLPVRYIRQPNRGLTASRNLGVRESRGSYILFLDADDRLKPHAIEAGVGVLSQHPECAMTVGDHSFVSADGSFLAGSRKTCISSAHYEALLRSNFIEMISSVLFRKSVLEAIGGFDADLRVAEDYELYLRIAREHAICCHTSVVAEYRLHGTNVSHNSELMLTMTLDVLQRQLRYVRGSGDKLLAFLEGTRTWRRQYGRQLASEVARSSSALRPAQLRRKLLLLLGHYPQGLVLVLLFKWVPGLDKRKSGQGSQASRQDWPLLHKLHAWMNAPKPSSAPMS